MNLRGKLRASLKGALSIAVASLLPPLPGNAQTRRDSAGVEIVDNARPVWATGTGWRLAATPVFRTELASGPAPGRERRVNDRIQGMVRLSDGRTAVSNGKTYEIEIFDPAGRRVASIGRQGQGPGEFSELHKICRIRGNTLLAHSFLDGLHIFNSDGRFLRTLTPDTAGTNPPLPPLELQGCALDGSFIMMRSGFTVPRTVTANVTETVSAYVYDVDGKHRRTIGPMPGLIWTLAVDQVRPLLLGPSEVHAFDGRRFYTGFRERYEVRVYSMDAKLERIVKRQWAPVPVSAEDIRLSKENRAPAATMNPTSRAQALAVLDAQQAAKTHAAYNILMADIGGNLWVQDKSFPYAPARPGVKPPATSWSVFDNTGRWLGTVGMPERFTAMEIGADYVLGILIDDNDLEYVALYRLEKPTR